MKGKVVFIGGPTGVGKSALAVKLAMELGGEVVNADSLIFYRYFDTGTAKPTLQERRLVPHHLIDMLDPHEEFDAYRYAQEASRIIRTIWERGSIPLVVGGTGFYMKALYHGLPPRVDKDIQFRRRLLEEEGKRPGVLHERLARIDPRRAAEIHPKDKVRLVRALEIYHVTGRLPHEVWRERSSPLKEGHFLKLALFLPRNELYARINARVQRMVEAGLVEETQRVLSMGFSPQVKPLQAIGYKEALWYLRGLLSREEMISKIQRRTRNYAKRQITWFKKEGFIWVPPHLEEVLNRIRKWIEGDHQR